MKICFVSLFFPFPPSHGSPQRALNLIKQLHHHGHDIFLYALCENEVLEAHKIEMQKYCKGIKVFQTGSMSNVKKLFHLLFSSIPNIALSAYRPEIFQEIADDSLANRYDVVYTEILGVAEYGRKLKELYHIKWINGSENIEFRRTLSYLSTAWGHLTFDLKRSYIYLSAIRLKSYEKRLLKIADTTIVCTGEDKDCYQKLHHGEKIFVIGNGVELRENLDFRKAQRKTVAFLGMMNSLPNIQAVRYFVRDILPIIKQEIPDVLFMVIGDKPTREIASLESENIRVLGYIEDMSAIIEDIAIFVAPLISGGGIKNKTLFGMANQKPVVSTSHGATGLNVTNGRELFICDDPTSFAAAVINLFKNDELYCEVAKNGYNYVKQYHSWERCGALFNELLERL
jgi:glycosyltransferase involved in cell wall biosynthesis